MFEFSFRKQAKLVSCEMRISPGSFRSKRKGQETTSARSFSIRSVDKTTGIELLTQDLVTRPVG